MTYLLDVNVLVALMDQDHAFNGRAHDWFAQFAQASWATCPITENGVMRILGHQRYRSGPGSPAVVAEMLRTLRRHPGHIFWPDEISLLSFAPVRPEALVRSGRVTDAYLLALAVHKGGFLATFDRRLTATAVKGGAEALHLIV